MDIFKKTLCCLLLLLLLVPVLPASADEKLGSNKERLEKIQTQIEETIKGLKGKQTESGELSQDLDRLNTEVRRIERLERKATDSYQRFRTSWMKSAKLWRALRGR